MSSDDVPDLAPPRRTEDGFPPMAECPLVDEVEKGHREAVLAAWGGVLVAVLGVLSWSTYGFLACGIGALAFGVYARRYAPMEANADFAAGALLLVVLTLRLAGVL